MGDKNVKLGAITERYLGGQLDCSLAPLVVDHNTFASLCPARYRDKLVDKVFAEVEADSEQVSIQGGVTKLTMGYVTGVGLNQKAKTQNGVVQVDMRFNYSERLV